MTKLPLALIAAAILAIPVPSFAQGNALRLKTVVIDAGHGGKDAGCVSRDKQTYEKDIVLDIATRVSNKISAAYKEVNVITTRPDDKFVELEQRAVIANKANANLFISIHVNAVEKGTSANGFSIHVLGKSRVEGNDLYSKNLDLVKRENSVILLEDNYQTKYQGFDPNDPQSSIIFALMQNAYLTASLTFADDVAQAMKNGPIKHSRGIHQDPFWVLWRTAMPAVLIEVGFMTNPDDLAIIRTEEGREGIADNIFRAFCVFKTRYDNALEPATTTTPVTVPEEVKPAPEEVKTEEVKIEEKKVEEVKEEKPEVKAEEKKVEDIKVEEPVAVDPNAPYYGIQILATGKKMKATDPFFRGYEVQELQIGNLYKYVICPDSSLSNVKKSFAKVQKIFKDCYMVKVADGTTAPVH